VRVRFALDAAGFADRLLELARAACPGPEPPLHEHVRRLSLDDLYLATACSLGDERAWEELAGRHLGFIRDFALRFLGEAEAQDLASQVVADLWQRRKIGRFEGRSTLRTWLGAVVAHAALNALKSRRRAGPVDSDRLPGGAPSEPASVEPATREAGALLAQLAGEAIGSLPAAEKVLLRLYYEQGLTLDQIAVALRASKTALSRRLSRIRSGLRGAVESLARRSAGTSADALRAGIDLGRLDLDLGALLSPRLHGTENEEALSKSREDVPLGRLPG
jgi:RNA polymerase sigma-70 factor (ECF subfamily)